ncbi:hypothetical protein E3N88_31553 [Mikania micrantha]|uniref:RRM domain-containing protein n=1 Tax=Mikania micrantha TaxID=192012 RepID=A0A5N6MQM7_9ASTR|nr:hypothetical protein E3N88_31553 [Mikania micrantha]
MERGRWASKRDQQKNNEDWQEVINRKRRSREAQESKEHVTNYYISNLPDDVTAKEVWGAFKEYGDIVDAFVPKHKDRSGSRFAFVRFANVQDANDLESALKLVKVGGAKVTANIAKYGRDKRPVDTGTIPPLNQYRSHKPKGVHPSCTRPMTTGFTNAYRSQRSYKDVTMGGDTMIGKIKSLNIINRLKNELAVVEMNGAYVRYVGGLNIMITFQKASFASQFLEDKSIWEKWFEWLQLWNGQPVEYERIAWVRIYGVPIYLWDKDVFNCIGEKCGQVMQASSASWEDGNFSFDRIGLLVKKRQLGCIQQMMGLNDGPIINDCIIIPGEELVNSDQGMEKNVAGSLEERIENQDIRNMEVQPDIQNQEMEETIKLADSIDIDLTNFKKQTFDIKKSQNYMIVSGQLTSIQQTIHIANIYAPQDNRGKRRLWDTLLDLIKNQSGYWLLMGDFNEVRAEEERLNSAFDIGASNCFNNFILNANLSEYHMGGRKFTYMTKKLDKGIKIDRFLVCGGFVSQWPNATVTALDREVSDHCPLILKTSEVDFGPTPFKFFNTWLKKDGIDDIVNQAALSSLVIGQPDVVLLAKLRNIKKAIRLWSAKEKEKEMGRLAECKNKANVLSLKAEIEPLSESELSESIPVNKDISGPWRSIAKVENVLIKHNIDVATSIKAVVGTGEQIRFWLDPWLSETPFCSLFPNLFLQETSKDIKVDHLIDGCGQMGTGRKRHFAPATLED